MGKRRGSGRISEAGEEAILGYFRRHHLPSTASVPIGIGDDAALLRLGPGKGRVLATVDLMVEGIHFRQSGTGAADLGYKLAAVNVSDMAAMGGQPLFALLSLALPAATELDFVRRFSAGLKKASRQFGMELVGGDTTASPGGIFAGLTLLGRLSGRRPLTRSGARPGDRILVTGHLGASSLGLAALDRKLSKKYPVLQGAVRKHRRPSPPLDFAAALARKGLATAAIDISDGLSIDLNHLCCESAAGAEVLTPSLPIRPLTRRGADILGSDALEAALHGGEEYELLFTVRPGKTHEVQKLGRALKTSITPIGKILRDRKVWRVESDGGRTALLPGGWRHF